MAEARDHRKQHIEFCETFSAENISKWSTMVDKWNEDPKTAPDPYEEPELGMILHISVLYCFLTKLLSQELLLRTLDVSLTRKRPTNLAEENCLCIRHPPRNFCKLDLT